MPTQIEEELLIALSNKAVHYCENNGGYPSAYQVVKGEFLVCAKVIDEHEPDLVVIPLQEALQFFQSAKDGLDDGKYEDFFEALCENGL
jgi:hypothetical protein